MNQGKTSEKRGLLEKVKNIDRKLMFALMAILMAVPYFRPLGLPMEISVNTNEFYDLIESAEAGDVVLIYSDYDLSNMPSVGGGIIGSTKQLIRLGLKAVYVTVQPQGPLVFETHMRPIFEEAGYKDGVDFVNLGYATGGLAMVARIADDIKAVYTEDWLGRDVDDMPMMKDISNHEDFAFVLCYASGSVFAEQWYVKYGTTILATPMAVEFMQSYPLYEAGSIAAMLNGPRGCAEYEQLLKAPGWANQSIDAISIGHLLILTFMVIGNITFFIDKYKGGK